MKKEQGFSVIETVLILAIVGLIGFVGWFVHNAQSKTNKNFSNSVQASSLRAKPAAKAPSTSDTEEEAAEAALPDTAVTKTPTTAEKQAIQVAATAYLHRTASGANSDTPSFRPQEKTLISEDRKFAIQWLCAPVEGGCDQILLKKVGATWVPLAVDNLIPSERINANKQYGWPLDFF